VRNRITTLVCAAIVAVTSQASLHFDFAGGPPSVRGLARGTKIAWMGMLRERAGGRSRMTVLRGVEPVTPDGHLTVGRTDRDFSRSIWLVAELDGPAVLQGGAPGYPAARDSIAVRAVNGEAVITVHSPSIHLTCVRRKGGGVWMFAASDGSSVDADGLQDGTIVIRLDALVPYRGNPNPPATLLAGDLLLLLDPKGNRATAREVSE